MRDSDSDSEAPRAGSPSLRRGEKAGTPASENIDGGRLDTGEARRKFGAASLSESTEEKRSFSRRLPSTSTYSLQPRTRGVTGEDDVPEKETTLERLRRLRSEVEELEQDVLREKLEDVAVEDPSSSTAKGKKKEVSPAVILQQLQMLRGDLSGVEVQVTGKSVLEGEGEKEGDDAKGLAQKAKASSSLLSKLGLGSIAPSPPSQDITTATKQKREEGSGDLEKRVASVEKALGANEADVDESHPLPPPLLSTLTRLDHLLTLLTQPRHLDSISRRVKVLVSDLERLHESRRKLGDTRPLNVALSGGMTVAVPGTGDGAKGPASSPVLGSAAPKPVVGGGGGEAIAPDTLQKVDALFALLPRLDPLLPLTPRLLTRLRSLATLHSSAASFGETLSGLKAEMDRLGEGEKGLSEVLDGLERSVKENEGKVRGNLEGLDERLSALVQRMEKLGV
ncbi:Dynamitin subunit 2 [Pseudohyphozyma bogoriensis]|nr:Dynamitin subunit 2 [Pseudohyphozyma bogoriensis]